MEIPELVPAMVLRDIVFFPHSILPLYIFEQHYRQMLDDALNSHRMFTVINSLPDHAPVDADTPINECVTLGCIKACQTYADGTSMVLLEGICRLTVKRCCTDAPYLQLVVSPVQEHSTDPIMLQSLRSQTLQLLEKIYRKGGEISDEAIEHLRQINHPQHFVDHAAASFLKNPNTTQQLLKHTDPVQRYSSLLEHLARYYERMDLLHSIIGDLSSDEIRRN